MLEGLSELVPASKFDEQSRVSDWHSWLCAQCAYSMSRLQRNERQGICKSLLLRDNCIKEERNGTRSPSWKRGTCRGILYLSMFKSLCHAVHWILVLCWWNLLFIYWDVRPMYCFSQDAFFMRETCRLRCLISHSLVVELTRKVRASFWGLGWCWTKMQPSWLGERCLRTIHDLGLFPLRNEERELGGRQKNAFCYGGNFWDGKTGTPYPVEPKWKARNTFRIARLVKLQGWFDYSTFHCLGVMAWKQRTRLVIPLLERPANASQRQVKSFKGPSSGTCRCIEVHYCFFLM